MSDQQAVVDRAAGEDILGRRVFFANVDRARAFGGSSLSGVLDVVGGLVLVAAVVIIVGLFLGDDGQWLAAAVVAVGGVTCGLTLFAMARVVTYVKACAVLLAKLTADRS
jgi:hypothetical protein